MIWFTRILIREEVIPGSLTSVVTCPSEVKKILEKLNPNKAAGVDSIPARLLKCVAYWNVSPCLLVI